VKYTAIRSEGGLLPYDLLDEILAETALGQKAADFGLPKGRRLSDEIQRVWSDALELWSRFKAGREKLSEKDPHGTTLTRDRWIGPLLTDPVRLSYDLHYQQSALVLDGLTFAISHRAGEPADSPPVHIEGCEIELDKRPPKYRISPQAMVQEFLNRSEPHLWGVATNGLRFRLLRDSVRTARPTYLEFDLETILEGANYSEFALFYRLCHRTRLPQSGRPPEECLLEKYYQESIEKGGRVREKLRDGVEEALKVLGTGFLRHSENSVLRDRVSSLSLTADQYHRQLLLLVYRLLFLTVAEDRHLITSIGENANRNQTIYRDYYSIGKLRERAEGVLDDSGFSDLWTGLTRSFRLFADLNDTNPLAIPPLNGDLFSGTTIPDLEGAQLSNLDLLKALRWLLFYREKNVQQRVNYAALNVEELGSIYESLLDFRPLIAKEPEGLKFDLGVGSERKTTGSYYTRPELVRELIQSALVPVMEERLADAEKQTKGQSVEAIRDVKCKAILDFSVCDPACGSGHFLLEAARRLGKELSQIRVGEDEPTPEQFHIAVRDVISHCIHGVDFNPLAVDLCKLALWLEGHWSGKPLSFLDHRIRCGNSLIGVQAAGLMESGLPDDAFTPVLGDDKKAAAFYKKRNKAERSFGQKRFEFERGTVDHSHEYSTLFGLQLDFPEHKPSDVQLKAALFEEARSGGDWSHDWSASNLWVASFFLPLNKLDDPLIPTHEAFTSYLIDRQDRPQMTGNANALATELCFFHWYLEFPDVNERGGFDVVIGNPPWERIKLSEEEFWASEPYIASSPNKAQRGKRIEEYRSSGDPQKEAKVARFDAARHSAEVASKFMRISGRYPNTAVGDVNTYALFAECARQLINPEGRAGLVLPLGIATDDTTKMFFGDLVDTETIVNLTGFENESFIFAAVHHAFKFCTLTISGARRRNSKADFTFFCRHFEDVQDTRRHFQLSREDLILLNPNTHTCPVFRSRIDAEITKKIYRDLPIFVNDKSGTNPWQVRFMRVFDMNKVETINLCVQDIAEGEKTKAYLRMYESKMMWQFDHRWGTYDGGVVRKLSEEERPDREFKVTPRYWLPAEEVRPRLEGWKSDWLLCFRDITSATNERTCVATVIPFSGTDFTLRLLLSPKSPTDLVMLLSNLNGLIFDYFARQRVAGSHLSDYITKQLPVLTPDRYTPGDKTFIIPRTVELVYTTLDLEPFAKDVGYDGGPFAWNGQKRAKLRAELDAYYAHLYGLTRDELRYLLDPKEVFGDDFPSETFRVLRNKDEEQFGEYCTQTLVLNAFEELAVSRRFKGEVRQCTIKGTRWTVGE
jgi:hypothetical protein